MELKDAIQSLAIFQNLSNEDIEYLRSISHLSKYNSECILLYEMESTDKLLFLIDGLIKVYKIDKYDNEIFLYYVYPGNMISELSNLTDTKITCFSNSEFIKESYILSVDFKEFKEKFLADNTLISSFISELIIKNQQFQCIINRELVFDATSKVAFMLINDLEMFNELKRNEVSLLLHIQPETLSRVLKRLSRSEIIAIEKNKVIIIKNQELQDIYLGR